MRQSYILLIVLLSLLLGALVTYLCFPREVVHERVVVNYEIVEVPIEVCSNKPVDCITAPVVIDNCTVKENIHTHNRTLHHKAYIKSGDVLEEAGSTYTNVPTKCAKEHNRSAC